MMMNFSKACQLHLKLLWVILFNCTFGNLVYSQQAPGWTWAERIIKTDRYGSVLAYKSNLSLDVKNNLVMNVPVKGIVTVEDSIAEDVGRFGKDMLVKLDIHGNLLWFDIISTSFASSAIDMSTNDIYYTGEFSDTLRVDTVSLVSTENKQAICLVKYNEDGDFIWAKKIDRAGIDLFDRRSIDVNTNGDVFVGGIFNDTIRFDHIEVLPSGPLNAFIAKYNSSGTPLWVRKIGSPGCRVTISSITADDNGNSYAAGLFRDSTLTIGSHTFTPNGTAFSPDIFLAKFDSSGSVLWAKQLRYDDNGCGSGIDGISSMKAYKNALFIVGSFQDTLDLGSGNFEVSSSGCNMFMAKLDVNGNVEFINKSLSTNALGNDISVDSSGNSYVTGTIHGVNSNSQAMFDHITISHGHGQNLYVVKYDLQGNLQWVKTSGLIGSVGQSGGRSLGVAIASTVDGDCFITGSMVNRAVFDTITLQTGRISDTDLMIARLGDLTTSIKKIRSSQLVLKTFPNPSDGELKIELPMDSKGVLTIYNSNGKMIHQEDFTNVNNKTINLSEHSSGYYYYRFVSKESGVGSGKLIIY